MLRACDGLRVLVCVRFAVLEGVLGQIVVKALWLGFGRESCVESFVHQVGYFEVFADFYGRFGECLLILGCEGLSFLGGVGEGHFFLNAGDSLAFDFWGFVSLYGRAQA